MSKITTLVILLIAAATSSSSSASNSSIESKAEDNSVAKSSLIIDKSSGKPNNKDWSFEEFENTMERDLGSWKSYSSLSSQDEWCFCERRRRNGDDDDYDDDRYDDDGGRCSDYKNKRRCRNDKNCRWTSSGECRSDRRLENEDKVDENEASVNDSRYEDMALDNEGETWAEYDQRRETEGFDSEEEEEEMSEEEAWTAYLDTLDEKDRMLNMKIHEKKMQDGYVPVGKGDEEMDEVVLDGKEEEDNRDLMGDGTSKRQRMQRIRQNNRRRDDDDDRRRDDDDDDRGFGGNNGYTAGRRPPLWWSSSRSWYSSSGDWWGSGGGFRPNNNICRQFGRSSNCDRAGCRWLSRFNECVARVGGGNYNGGGWRPPQCRDIWRERRCLNAPGCAWTCTARWNYANENVESLVVEEPVSMMKEKSSNSAAGKISIGLTSMVMIMMMFWS